MEKRTPSYSLQEIQRQMATPTGLRMTKSARDTATLDLEFDTADIIAAIQGIERSDFYKSMTTYHDHRVWQDVYCSEHGGVELYIKFQQYGDEYYTTVSFKLR